MLQNYKIPLSAFFFFFFYKILRSAVNYTHRHCPPNECFEGRGWSFGIYEEKTRKEALLMVF